MDSILSNIGVFDAVSNDVIGGAAAAKKRARAATKADKHKHADDFPTNAIMKQFSAPASMPPSKYQKDIAKTYRAHQMPKIPPMFDDFCFPKEYKLQKQQTFSGDFMRPSSGNKNLLMFHRIGAGKTCAAIQIALKWIKLCKPLVLMPASLIPGFISELLSPCAGELFIAKADRAQLSKLSPTSREYRNIIADATRRSRKSSTLLHTINSRWIGLHQGRRRRAGTRRG